MSGETPPGPGTGMAGEPRLLAQATPGAGPDPAPGVAPDPAPGADPAPSAPVPETPAPDASAGEPTTLLDLLDALRQPEPPAPVAMTPQTPGWIVLGAALLLLLAWGALIWRRRRRANAWRREALAALAEAGDDPAAVAPILRRAALALHPRAEVAGLTGERWLRFLDGAGGPGFDRAGGPGFAEGPGRALAAGPYDGRGAPAPGLGALAARWVRRARPEPRR